MTARTLRDVKADLPDTGDAARIWTCWSERLGKRIVMRGSVMITEFSDELEPQDDWETHGAARRLLEAED